MIPDYILDQIPKKAYYCAEVCRLEWPSRLMPNGYAKENAELLVISGDMVIPVYGSDVGEFLPHMGKVITEEMLMSARIFGTSQEEFDLACKHINANKN